VAAADGWRLRVVPVPASAPHGTRATGTTGAGRWLAYDSKFDFKVIVDLPWSEVFFKISPRPAYGQTLKMGTLHPSLLRAVQAAYDAAKSR